MKLVKRVAIAAPVFTCLLVVSACGGSGPTDDPTSSSPPNVSVPARSSAPAQGTPGNAAPSVDQSSKAPGVTPGPDEAIHDDDPGGHPCTDQSGAPGKYTFDDSSNIWVCEITGDAPPR